MDNKINMLVRHFFIAGKFGVNMWRSIKNFFSKSNDYMEIVPKWLMIGPIFFLDYIGLFVKCTFSNLPAFLRALIEFSLFASPTILVAFLFRTFEKKRGNFSGKTEGEEGTFFAGVPKMALAFAFYFDSVVRHLFSSLLPRFVLGNQGNISNRCSLFDGFYKRHYLQNNSADKNRC